MRKRHLLRLVGPWIVSTCLTATAAVLTVPSRADAYCWWQWCNPPNEASCPNYCGDYNYYEFFFDWYCDFVGEPYCRHIICFHLDNGYPPSSCPSYAVCDSSDYWDCNWGLG